MIHSIRLPKGRLVDLNPDTISVSADNTTAVLCRNVIMADAQEAHDAKFMVSDLESRSYGPMATLSREMLQQAINLIPDEIEDDVTIETDGQIVRLSFDNVVIYMAGKVGVPR